MKLMIFSGTTEGHDLCRFLSKNNVQAEVFVATEYGAAVMEPMAGITVHEGRLDEREMEKRLTSDTLLIDATHPYAAAVTDNLRAACAKSGASSFVVRFPSQRLTTIKKRQPLSIVWSVREQLSFQRW